MATPRLQLNISVNTATEEEYMKIVSTLAPKNKALTLRRLMALYNIARAEAPTLIEKLKEVE